LSIKAKEVEDEDEALNEYGRSVEETAAPTTLGDLLKAQMERQ